MKHEITHNKVAIKLPRLIWALPLTKLFLLVGIYLLSCPASLNGNKKSDEAHQKKIRKKRKCAKVVCSINWILLTMMILLLLTAMLRMWKWAMCLLCVWVIDIPLLMQRI